MFLSVIVIARDGEWTPSNGTIYGVFLACVLLHGVLASTMSKIMGKLQTVFVVMNLVLIFATIIALPIGKSSGRNDGSYIFATTANLTTWPTGWAFFLAWLSPIWTVGSFDSCVHMSEEAANATKAVPWGIIHSAGSCWLLGFVLMIVIAACMSTDLESILGSSFGQPMAQVTFHPSLPFIFCCKVELISYFQFNRSTTTPSAKMAPWASCPFSWLYNSSWVFPYLSPPAANPGPSPVMAHFHSPHCSATYQRHSGTFRCALFGAVCSLLLLWACCL